VRRNRWRKRKLLTDPEYQGNQRDAQKRWRESHKEYWRGYRASHPDYVKRNRALQRERNDRRRGSLIAKRDEYLVKIDILPGAYP